MGKKKAIAMAAPLAAALLALCGCSASAPQDGLEAFDGAVVETEGEAAAEEARAAEADYSGHKGFELADGCRFYDQEEEYTAQEAEAAEAQAARIAEEFCEAVFGFAGGGDDLTWRLAAMTSDADGAWDNYGKIYETFSGSAFSSSFGGFTPCRAYAADAGSFGRQLNLTGIASVRMSNDMIPEGDYDMAVKLILLDSGSGWKVYDARFDKFYEAGTASIATSEVNEILYDVDGEYAGSIGWEDPEGYLSGYTYGLDASEIVEPDGSNVIRVR